MTTAYPGNIIDPHYNRPLLDWRVLECGLYRSPDLGVGLGETCNVDQAFGTACNGMILRYTS